jgi:hypothetical protein
MVGFFEKGYNKVPEKGSYFLKFFIWMNNLIIKGLSGNIKLRWALFFLAIHIAIRIFYTGLIYYDRDRVVDKDTISNLTILALFITFPYAIWVHATLWACVGESSSPSLYNKVRFLISRIFFCLSFYTIFAHELMSI